MEFLLIGITGPAGSGKTTAANLICSETGFLMWGFSDPIKEAARSLCPSWDSWHFSAGKDFKSPNSIFSPRDVLRVIGDHGRSLQWDLYIRHMARRLRIAKYQKHRGVVIHDLRLNSEAEWLRGLGGVLIHVRRSGVEFRGDHETECGVTGIPGDVSVTNSGELQSYKSALLASLCDIRRRPLSRAI